MDKKNLSTLTPILSNVFARRHISVLDRHITCHCFEKTERVARNYNYMRMDQDRQMDQDREEMVHKEGVVVMMMEAEVEQEEEYTSW